MVHFTIRRALYLTKHSLRVDVIQIKDDQQDGKNGMTLTRWYFVVINNNSPALTFKKSIAQVKGEDNLAEIQFLSQWQEWARADY